MQSEIDRIKWYHDFDFPGGLKARTKTPDANLHRQMWRFIEGRLDTIDFRGKSVLDVGCWDGYWSFYAERRGAAAVLAADDISQNWAAGAGLPLAKRLYGSNIEINQELSVYELSSLERKFDVILCLGVYYHLYDPFYALAQIRHCCHPESIVVFEGDVGLSLLGDAAQYCFSDASRQAFVPSVSLLQTMFKATYFETVQTTKWKSPNAAPPSILKFLARSLHQFWRNQRDWPADTQLPIILDRMLTVCKPFHGQNDAHPYKPPFGLEAYDSRFALNRFAA